jgi:hypothetical protein
LPPHFLDRLKAHQLWAQDADPDHPTYTVLGSPYQVRPYMETFDAIGTDPYPVPFNAASQAGAWARETVNQVEGTKPVWMVPQAMNWAHYYSDERKSQARAPTYDELRSMSWQCIVEGAGGLVYYTWEEMDRNPGFWEKVKKVAVEIRDLSPVLVEGEDEPAVAVVGGGDAAGGGQSSFVRHLGRHYQGKLYVIVVNNGDGQGQIACELPRQPSGIKVYGEDRAIPPAKRFTDDLPKLGVRVYAITP